MYLSTFFSLVTLAATVSAIPSPVSVSRPTSNSSVELTFEQASDFMSRKKADGCGFLKCALDLAPTVVACAAAVAEDGLNVFVDAACLVSAAHNLIDTPTVCQNCL